MKYRIRKKLRYRHYSNGHSDIEESFEAEYKYRLWPFWLMIGMHGCTSSDAARDRINIDKKARSDKYNLRFQGN